MNEGRFRSASDASADAGQAALNSFAAADINKLLKRVLESSCFRGSLRLTNFLKFVVETTLAGKAANIKAYTIAVEALNRGCDFDPQSDPIVRVEAGRLRQALARYYGDAGRDESVLIELPRGTYVPVFRRREPTPPQVSAAHDSVPPAGLELLAASWRESQLLHKAVTQQSKEVAAQIAVTRATLADSRALLQQPLPGIASHSAPPLSPASSPVADDEKPADRESAERLSPAASGIRRTFPFDAAGKSRLRKYGRAVRIVLYVIGIVAFLQSVFDIERPLTGGKNKGLIFRALAAHNLPSQQAGRGI